MLMHIPDGFLSPQTWIPATLIAAPLLMASAAHLKAALQEARTIPRLVMISSLVYALNMVMIPLPGGASAHLIGVPLLALLFGIRLAFLASALVFALQALLLGAGGITSLGVNILFVAGLPSVLAVAIYRLTHAWGDTVSLALSAFCALFGSAFAIAMVLGLQPLIAHAQDGSPLFFPFDWKITVPAILIPHFLIALLEAFLTVFVWQYAKARRWDRAWAIYHA